MFLKKEPPDESHKCEVIHLKKTGLNGKHENMALLFRWKSCSIMILHESVYISITASVSEWYLEQEMPDSQPCALLFKHLLLLPIG